MKVTVEKVNDHEVEKRFAQWAVQMYRHQADVGNVGGDTSHRFTGEHGACGNDRVPQRGSAGRYPLGYMF